MNRSAFVLLALALNAVSSSAAAAPSEETKRECAEASFRGQTARDEGRLLAAREDFLRCADDVCPTIVKQRCAQWFVELEERLPSVIVRVQDERGNDVTDARIAIDDEEAELNGRPVALDPGPHVVVVRQADGNEVKREFLLAEGERARPIAIELPHPVSAGTAIDDQGEVPFYVPTGAWVLGGVSLAALGSFTYFNIMATKEFDKLRGTCGTSCLDEETRIGRRNQLAANVSLGVGAAALAGAIGWVLFRPALASSSTQVAILPTRSGAFATIVGHY